MSLNTYKKLDYNYNPSYSFFLLLLLLSRFFSEIIFSFTWNSANYVWSTLALMNIGVLFWPLLVLNKYKFKENIFVKYSPIFIYLFYLLSRLQVFDKYSIKCFFAEFIVWFFFIFTSEFCSRDFHVARTIQIWIIRLVKVISIIGVIQIAIFALSNNSFYLIDIFESRPVKGIFAHANIFIIFTLPFVFYFFKKKAYFWFSIVLLACIGTGTRSPFLAVLCMTILVFKFIYRKKISWGNIFVTLIITAVVYYLIIERYANGTLSTVITSQEGERFTLDTFKWRVSFWESFLRYKDVFITLFGRGIGSADMFAADLTNGAIFCPHNDYIRIYYDTGIIGIIFFFNLIFFMLRLLKKAITTSNDFILLSYILIICFCITDNFIYSTNYMFIYMFIASFLKEWKNPQIADEDFASK